MLPVAPPSTPGLFIAATDTGVGKTVVACLIAQRLLRAQRARDGDSRARSRIGVFKPVATGCRREREGLVSEDAEQLAHAADFDPEIGDLSVVNPVRFRAPVAPAEALARMDEGASLDVEAMARALARMDQKCEAIVVEGIGGVMTPLAGTRKSDIVTCLDLMKAIGYPVVVVCRAGLGTLNHTALTYRAIRGAGLSIAGIVINGYDPESADESMVSNRRWLERQNGVPILAILPEWVGSGPRRRKIIWEIRAIDPALGDAIDVIHWESVCRPGRRV